MRHQTPRYTDTKKKNGRIKNTKSEIKGFPTEIFAWEREYGRIFQVKLLETKKKREGG